MILRSVASSGVVMVRLLVAGLFAGSYAMYPMGGMNQGYGGMNPGYGGGMGPGYGGGPMGGPMSPMGMGPGYGGMSPDMTGMGMYPMPVMGNPMSTMTNMGSMYGQAGPAMIQSMAPKLKEILQRTRLSMPGVSPMYDRKTQTPIVWIHLRKAPPIVLDREFYNISAIQGMNITNATFRAAPIRKISVPETQLIIPSIWGDGFPLQPEHRSDNTTENQTDNKTSLSLLRGSTGSFNGTAPLPQESKVLNATNDTAAARSSFMETKVDPEMIRNGLYLSMPLRSPAQETMNIAAVEDTRGIQGVADFLRKKREIKRLNNRFTQTLQQLVVGS